MTQEAPGRGIKFRESMPRPLMIAFLATGAVAVGVIVWLLVSPPTPSQLDIASRRSAPSGSLSHDVLRVEPAPVPTPLPDFSPPCDAVAGVVVEGGEAAQGRIRFVLSEYLCRIEGDTFQPAEVRRAIRGLKEATIRFGIFTRTGEQSTFDRATTRILLNVDLARTSIDPIVIAPLLVHEGWHLAAQAPFTAEQEYGARLAEVQACRVIFRDREPSRGCLDAQAIVALGEARATDLLFRSGFPRVTP
ncbi:MAG: hypothetical protein ACRDJ1_03300 [Actinomycetota bacterium]